MSDGSASRAVSVSPSDVFPRSPIFPPAVRAGVSGTQVTTQMLWLELLLMSCCRRSLVVDVAVVEVVVVDVVLVVVTVAEMPEAQKIAWCLWRSCNRDFLWRFATWGVHKYRLSRHFAPSKMPSGPSYGCQMTMSWGSQLVLSRLGEAHLTHTSFRTMYVVVGASTIAMLVCRCSLSQWWILDFIVGYVTLKFCWTFKYILFL